MYVFWVLFLVLLKTIGNQGDPNHGLKNFKNGSGGIPLYIVSMRNHKQEHICTGSIISTKLILAITTCSSTTHILQGLKEYERYRQTGELIEVTVMGRTKIAILFKVAKEFHRGVPKLYIPPNSNSRLPPTGAVVGWYCDDNKTYVMKEEAVENTTEAFSGYNEEFFWPFYWFSDGSPLIGGNVIYGFVEEDTHHWPRFKEFLPDVDEINKIINRTS